MPRGRKKKIIQEESLKVEKSVEKSVEKLLTREEILKQAKKLGLFQRNKYNATYEIIVPIKEYEQI